MTSFCGASSSIFRTSDLNVSPGTVFFYCLFISNSGLRFLNINALAKSGAMSNVSITNSRTITAKMNMQYKPKTDAAVMDNIMSRIVVYFAFALHNLIALLGACPILAHTVPVHHYAVN